MNENEIAATQSLGGGDIQAQIDRLDDRYHELIGGFPVES